MAQDQRKQSQVAERTAPQAIPGGREGARWINRRPDAEEFASWFSENVPFDEGMDPKNYVGGMTLIPAEEKVKYVKAIGANGVPVISQKEQLVYVPYPKVEARVSYYWKLMELRKEDWIGVIEQVDTPRLEDDSAVGQINRVLPTGFFVLPVPVNNGYTYFICCTTSVKIYERPVDSIMQGDRVVITSVPIRQGRGTKQIPLLKGGYNNKSPYADDVAIMRAETGSLGRALGMAGILIVPGSSIATAEDMLEGFGTTTPPQVEQASAQLTLPEIQPAAPIQTGAEQVESDRATMIEQAREILGVLHEKHPNTYEEFRVWAASKKPPVRNIGDQDGAALRGCVKKLQTLLSKAEEVAAQDASGEAPQAPPEVEKETGDG